jgi:4a-hydroxytetrahydrobiopterin dehydratase
MMLSTELRLAQEQTRASHEGQTPLGSEEAQQLAAQVPEWKLGPAHLHRDFKFRDFDEAIDFVNEVANIAAAADHHPDIQINYSKVHLSLSTHKIGGLSRNDFIVAARISEL